MKSLTEERMQDLHGSWWPKRGVVCGTMVGAVAGAVARGWFVPAAYTFMFTPLACLLDYGLR